LQALSTIFPELLTSPDSALAYLPLPATPGNAGSKEGVAPLLLARCNALLVQLSEFSSPSLVDSLVLQQSSKLRLLRVVHTSCRLAQQYLQPARFPPSDQVRVTRGV
jgi:hypothetical protein